MKKKVIIIGAGASGIMAALALADQYEVLILEAKDQIGGRIHHISVGEETIATGAEFIHGELRLTNNILKEAGLSPQAINGKFTRIRKGKAAEDDDPFLHWDELLDKMGKLEMDIPLTRFLEISFPGDQWASFRYQVEQYAGGFDLADPVIASTQKLYREWRNETTNYRVENGYEFLIEHFNKSIKKQNIPLRLNTICIEVHHGNKITVITNKGTFNSDIIIISASLGCLKQKNIQFFPPLPQYEKAITQIGFGSIVKCIAFFKKPVWKKDDAFFLSDEAFPTWWTQSPLLKNYLTGWCGGPKALQMKNLHSEEIKQKAKNALSSIFGMAQSELEELVTDIKIFNWENEPFISGGYSFDTTASADARKMLQLPVDECIYFTGEAVYDGKHPGTVEAALQSGVNTAELILSQHS